MNTQRTRVWKANQKNNETSLKGLPVAKSKYKHQNK